jgi:hypothetical protein
MVISPFVMFADQRHEPESMAQDGSYKTNGVHLGSGTNQGWGTGLRKLRYEKAGSLDLLLIAVHVPLNWAAMSKVDAGKRAWRKRTEWFSFWFGF